MSLSRILLAIIIDFILCFIFWKLFHTETLPFLSGSFTGMLTLTISGVIKDV